MSIKSAGCLAYKLNTVITISATGGYMNSMNRGKVFFFKKKWIKTKNKNKKHQISHASNAY